MKRTLLLLGGLLLLASCSHLPNHETSSHTLTAQNSLTLEGSNETLPALVPLTEAFRKANSGANLNINITDDAALIQDFLSGKKTSVYLAERLSKEQTDTGSLHINEIPLANRTIVFVVNEANPVKTLSVEQIGQILRGEVINWTEVHGQNMKVTIDGPSVHSPIYTYVHATVIHGNPSPEYSQKPADSDILSAVAITKTAIGFVPISAIEALDAATFSHLKILLLPSTNDGTPVSPMDSSVLDSGVYPLHEDIFHYVSAQPDATSMAATFLSYEKSSEAKTVLEKAGF